MTKKNWKQVAKNELALFTHKQVKKLKFVQSPAGARRGEITLAHKCVYGDVYTCVANYFRFKRAKN
jgi:hypothetical protein